MQGVGFRPFLHRLTERCSLSGWARNTSAGVELELEGDEARLADFLRALEEEKPPLAVIRSTERTDLPMCKQGETEVKPVIIEDDVWLGARVTILPGARIGHGCVIGAGAVVSGEVPPMSVAVGNPARVVKKRE